MRQVRWLWDGLTDMEQFVAACCASHLSGGVLVVGAIYAWELIT